MRAFFIALLLASVASAADAWLEGVKPVIRSEEEKAYLALSDDAARDQFRQAFWQQRNVTAAEYFERLALVDAQFGSVKVGSGARTDQGRVMLSLGRPSRIQRFASSRAFVQSELWDYEAAPAAGIHSAVRLIFYRPNNTGLYKLYSPTVDTIRSLLNPQSNNKGLFPVNDVITENDIAQRIQASPAEMEILQAAVSVARGIAGLGNDEILARALSPRTALMKQRLSEQVESRLLRSAPDPEVTVYWGVAAEDGTAPARVAVRLPVAGTVRMTLEANDKLVDDVRLNLGFSESKNVQLLRRYTLLTDLGFNLTIEVDGRTYQQALSSDDAGKSAGSLLVGTASAAGPEGDQPFRFGTVEFQPGSTGQQAALPVSHPTAVRWKLLRNGRAFASWTTSASDVRGDGLAVTVLPPSADLKPGGDVSIEVEVDGEYRSAPWSVTGVDDEATVISYNADLSMPQQANLVGLQYLAAGRPEAAKASFEQAMSVPSLAAIQAKIHLSRSLIEQGDLDSARSFLIEALQQSPHDAAALTLLGLVEDRSGNVAQSAQYYRRAMAIVPSPELQAALQRAEATR